MKLTSLLLALLLASSTAKLLQFLGSAFLLANRRYTRLSPVKSLLINRLTAPKSPVDSNVSASPAVNDYQQHRLIDKELKYLSTVLVDWDKLPLTAQTNFRETLIEKVPKMEKDEIVGLLESLSKLRFSWSSLPQYLQRIVQDFLVLQIGKLEPHQIASVTLSFADLGAKYDDFIPKFQSKLASKVYTRIKQMSKSDVAKTAFALTAMDWRTDERFQALVSSVVTNAHQMNVQQVAHSLYALSRVEGKWSELSEANQYTLLLEVGRIYQADLNKTSLDSSNSRGNSGNVTTLLYSLGCLGAKWSEMEPNVTVPLLTALGRATATATPTTSTAAAAAAASVLSVRDLAGLIYGLGRLGVRWSTLSTDLQASLQREISSPALLQLPTEIEQRQSDVVASDVVLLLWGLGQMGAPLSALRSPSPFPLSPPGGSRSLPLLLEAVQLWENSFTAEEVPLLLSGLSRLEGQSWEGLKPSLKSCLARLISTHVRDLSNGELGEVLQAMTLLSFDYQRDTVRVRNFNSLNRQLLDTAQGRISLAYDRRQALQLIQYLETMQLFGFDTKPVAAAVLGASDHWMDLNATSAWGEVAYGGFNYSESSFDVASRYFAALNASLDPARFKLVVPFQGHPQGSAFPPFGGAILSRGASKQVLVLLDVNKDDHFTTLPLYYQKDDVSSSTTAYRRAGVLRRPLQLKDSLYLHRLKEGSGVQVRHFSEQQLLSSDDQMRACVETVVNLVNNNYKKPSR